MMVVAAALVEADGVAEVGVVEDVALAMRVSTHTFMQHDSLSQAS